MGVSVNMRTQEDVIIIGGGPAGLAAAAAARKEGCGRILIIERDRELGGILNQCIHNGFGLHTFQEELTGPEYAWRYRMQIEEMKIPYLLDSMVTGIRLEEDTGLKIVTVMNRVNGIREMEAKTVILAMGCRERPRGALNIPGFRPAGIYSAGTAQRYVNMEGRMPGRRVVILGSGDIGLIMARRMTLEGAKVEAVAELMPYSGGLRRNIVQCLEDYNIPLKLSTTVVDIHGHDRVEAVTLSKVDDSRRPVPGTEEYIECDTLLLSCGLIPENELSLSLGVAMNPATGAPKVNESLETSVRGVFACGNVLHVHDLVDYVSGEAAMAGRYAVEYIRNSEAAEGNREGIEVCPGKGIRYTVPSLLRPARMEEKQLIRFRTDNVYKNVTLTVTLGDHCILRQKKRVMAPGEMEQVVLKRKDLEGCEASCVLNISIEEEQDRSSEKIHVR